MSKKDVLRFFQQCASDQNTLKSFCARNLAELVFHAKALGYRFSTTEMTSVVGAMEFFIITQKRNETLNAYSSLWPQMWGKSRLQYVVDILFNALTSDERNKLAEQ